MCRCGRWHSAALHYYCYYRRCEDGNIATSIHSLNIVFCIDGVRYAFASLIINKQGDWWGLGRQERWVCTCEMCIDWRPIPLNRETVLEQSEKCLNRSHTHTHRTRVSIVCRTIVITIVCHLPHKEPRNCSGKLVSFVYFYGFLRCSVHSHESYRYTPGIDTIHITQQQRCCRLSTNGRTTTLNETRLTVEY